MASTGVGLAPPLVEEVFTQAVNDLETSVPIGDHSSLRVDGQSSDLGLIDSIAPEWRKLCEAGACNQPFCLPEWIANSMRCFSPGQSLYLITARERDELRAVLPLYEKRTSWCGVHFRMLGGPASIGYGCRFDVIRGVDTTAAEIAAAMWNYLKNSDKWDVIFLGKVPEGATAEHLVLCALQDGFMTLCYEQARSPYLRLQSGATANDFARQGHFRRNLNRRWRKLEHQGSLRLRRVDEFDRAAIRLFYSMEHHGWKGRKGTAIACGQAALDFFDSVAECAARAGYLALYFLDFNDKPIAAHFGLAFGGVYYPIKTAFDETCASYSPGQLITSAIVQDCVDRGFCEVDFLGQWAQWKADWTETVRPHYSCYIFRDSIKGRILATKTRAEHAKENLVDKLREWVPKRSTR
jgi:CelD/BcsL family acetyltransferase involved in cellulose biosynthesis